MTSDTPYTCITSGARQHCPRLRLVWRKTQCSTWPPQPDSLTFFAVCSAPHDDGQLALVPAGHTGDLVIVLLFQTVQPFHTHTHLSLTLSFELRFVSLTILRSSSVCSRLPDTVRESFFALLVYAPARKKYNLHVSVCFIIILLDIALSEVTGVFLSFCTPTFHAVMPYMISISLFCVIVQQLHVFILVVLALVAVTLQRRTWLPSLYPCLVGLPSASNLIHHALSSAPIAAEINVLHRFLCILFSRISANSAQSSPATLFRKFISFLVA